jgi:hypothetical protein
MSESKVVPVMPTDEMLEAARGWSYCKYGKPIGNDAAIGCYKAMLAAAPSAPQTPPNREDEGTCQPSVVADAKLVQAAREVLKHYMPQFHSSLEVDECLVKLAFAVEHAERAAALDALSDNARELGLDYEPVADALVMQLWRKAGLPEYFLGNGGTNVHLVEFARLVREHAEPVADTAQDKERADLNKEWFERGRNAMRRTNQSGCCCDFGEDGETVISACNAHKDWKEAELEQLRSRVAELEEAALDSICRLGNPDITWREILAGYDRAEAAERKVAEQAELIAEHDFEHDALNHVDELERKVATIRAETIEECIKAIDDAGGDNAVYHMNAVRALAAEVKP